MLHEPLCLRPGPAPPPGGLDATGRVFLSPRLGVKALAARWRRALGAARPAERAAAERLALLAQRHASEGFFAFDDPLESAVVSVLVELAPGAGGEATLTGSGPPSRGGRG